MPLVLLLASHSFSSPLTPSPRSLHVHRPSCRLAPGILHSAVVKTALSFHERCIRMSVILTLHRSACLVALFTAGDGTTVTLWRVHRIASDMCSDTTFTRVATGLRIKSSAQAQALASPACSLRPKPKPYGKPKS